MLGGHRELGALQDDDLVLQAPHLCTAHPHPAFKPALAVSRNIVIMES